MLLSYSFSIAIAQSKESTLHQEASEQMMNTSDINIIESIDRDEIPDAVAGSSGLSGECLHLLCDSNQFKRQID